MMCSAVGLRWDAGRPGRWGGPGHVEGQDGGVVVHAGAEGVERVTDRLDCIRCDGGGESAADVEEGVVTVPVLAAVGGVGFGETVGVQEQDVARGEVDGGGAAGAGGMDAGSPARGRPAAWHEFSRPVPVHSPVCHRLSRAGTRAR